MRKFITLNQCEPDDKYTPIITFNVDAISSIRYDMDKHEIYVHLNNGFYIKFSCEEGFDVMLEQFMSSPTSHDISVDCTEIEMESVEDDILTTIKENNAHLLGQINEMSNNIASSILKKGV